MLCYVYEDFTLKHLFARESNESFVYKHSKTIEYVKEYVSLLFKKFTNFTGK